MKLQTKKIKKVLVANRGEIAIRVFRACTELGIRTVAIYSYEDRFSLHRYKADEAYQVGEEGSPVASYLSIDAIISIAKEASVDAIHPGYGFLSEKVEFAAACNRAGINFIGPTEETLLAAGSKVRTRELATSLKIPVIPGTNALKDAKEAKRFAKDIGYPVILKASFGGGGRGMRVVWSEEELSEQFLVASQEAQAAFGNGEIFLEKYISRPKHIEVQLLGDGTGEVVHLFERDCSIQRRHQKVIEVAPAVGLKEDIKQALYQYALLLGKKLSLRALSTCEFLVSESGEIYFIEINPRIQVEHTVTEEITGVDLVQSQIRVAQGEKLSELKLLQKDIVQFGAAIQCRITTEDPEKQFTPDYGRLVTYRSASGYGIRLDAGSAFTGAEIHPFYDSMLVKVTARGRELPEAARRLRRALSEFRIRGVKNNIGFLEKLLSHEVFLNGEARTDFLEKHPEVFDLPKKKDRANKLLRFLGEVAVNGHELMPDLKRPEVIRFAKVPQVIKSPDALRPPPGWRDIFLDHGTKGLIDAIKKEKSILLTDTTLRDAHQSLLATRMRTFDMLKVADAFAYNVPELFSLEMWGGATFDVALRFLHEDPWMRLRKLRERVPNILFQMLLRGANAVGYKSYPDNVIVEFVKESAKSGIDIFRIFDCFNELSRMETSIVATKDAGAIAEVCLCFSGDLLSANAKFDLKYFLSIAKDAKSLGADIIAIKDMAGLLRPYAAEKLIGEIKNALDMPVHFHTHDTAGAQAASYLKAAEAGVDIIDCAFSSMSGVTSQPSLEGIVAAFEHTERDTKIDVKRLTPISAYFESVRGYYAPFESDLKSATGEVYLSEIPGGQYSNFRPQAESVGLGDRWEELKAAYREVNLLFGDIIKVTPSSKVVGDLAIFMVANELTPEDVLRRAGELNFPESVLDFFSGRIGMPYGGFPEAFRKAVLSKRPELGEEPPLEPVDFVKATEKASLLLGARASMSDALSYVLYPKVFEDFSKARKDFGDPHLLPTTAFFYGASEGEELQVDIEPGKRLFISLEAISDVLEQGKRSVFFELNGQPRSIQIRDRSVSIEEKQHEKINAENKLQIGSPSAGKLVSISVTQGQKVDAKTPLFAIEAMKMQTVVNAPFAGVVKRLPLKEGVRVDTGDLIVELDA